ncbi:MAG: hypothetical protein LQ337_005661 [Flavoplaca oasis]|nr:MAG: hypothetical protein LQ337_005661 [Flavoplaca oasis]
MNVICLGSWRVLCKGLQSVPSSQPHLISWTAAIGDVSRPFRQPVRSFFTPKQIHPGATKCIVARLAHLSLSIKRSDNACLSTQAGARNTAASPSRVRSLIKSEAFSKEDIVSIFGKKVRHDEGNRLLHLIQEQRLSGTIDRETFASPEQKQKALSWLRKTYPVDEEQAIINRLEREENTALQSARHPSGSVYGDPVIDQIKRRNLARQAQKDEEKAKAEAEAHLDLPVSTTKAMAKREERRSMNRAWLQKYEKKAEEAGLESVPQMSFIRRVGPVTVAAFAPLFVLVSLVALDLIRLRRRSLLAKLIPGDTARIDHISHLAGYGFGLMAAQFLKLEPRSRQQKKSSQQIYDANPHEE